MKITPIFYNQNKPLIKNLKRQNVSFEKETFGGVTSYPNDYYLSFGAVKPIRFEKAQTIGEAKDFGRRILGIAQYTDFSDEFDDLNVINYINEGLVELRNNLRGKPRLPRYIYLEELDKIQMAARFFGGGELTVNRKIYGTEEIGEEIERIFNELKKDLVITDSSIASDFATTELKILFEKLLNQYENLEQLSYDEKIDLYNGIRTIYEKTSQLNRFPKDLIIKMFEAGCWGEFDETCSELFAYELKSCSDDENFKTLYNFLKEFGKVDFKIENNILRHKTLFHEVGHLQDMDIFFTPSVNDFSSCERYSKEMKEWLNDKEALQAAFEVSPYACYGASEFVAEAYALLASGEELSANAQKLYKKLLAPKVTLRQN